MDIVSRQPIRVGDEFYSRSKIRVILVECTGSDYNTRESAGSSFVNPLIRREPP